MRHEWELEWVWKREPLELVSVDQRESANSVCLRVQLLAAAWTMPWGMRAGGGQQVWEWMFLVWVEQGNLLYRPLRIYGVVVKVENHL